MTLATAEMRAAIVAQRQGPPKCERCSGPVWSEDQHVRLAALFKKHGKPLRPLRNSVGCMLCWAAQRPRNTIDVEAYEKWRNREAEANAWECDGSCDPLHGDDCPRNIGDEENEWRAVRESNARNETPGRMLDTHHDYVERRDAVRHLCTRGVMRLCENEYRAEWVTVPSVEMWDQPSRDVPAYAEVDRYDPQTGAPRRAYRVGESVETFHVRHNGVVVQTASRIVGTQEQGLLQVTRMQVCQPGDLLEATGLPPVTVVRAGTYVLRATFPAVAFGISQISPD